MTMLILGSQREDYSRLETPTPDCQSLQSAALTYTSCYRALTASEVHEADAAASTS